jgi:hypothetical protein
MGNFSWSMRQMGYFLSDFKNEEGRKAAIFS